MELSMPLSAPMNRTDPPTAPSIYQRVLGKDFSRLHPQIQRRFSLSSARHRASIGAGIMEIITPPPAFSRPFLRLGALRHIMFPESGVNIPFTVENYAFRDSLGREAVSWIRTFHFTDRVRRFDAYMIHSRRRGGIIDYLGTHQHLAVDLALSVSPCGGLRIRSGKQRFYEHLVGPPIPDFLIGFADVHEWFDERCGRFRIDVLINHRQFGMLFGYRGWFVAHEVPASGLPSHIAPRRVEARE